MPLPDLGPTTDSAPPADIDLQFATWLNRVEPNYARGEGLGVALRIRQFWEHLTQSEKSAFFPKLIAAGDNLKAVQAAVQSAETANPAAAKAAAATPYTGEAAGYGVSAAPSSTSAVQQSLSAPYAGTPEGEQALTRYQYPNQGQAGTQQFFLQGVNLDDPNAVAKAYGIDPGLLQQQWQSYTANYSLAATRGLTGEAAKQARQQEQQAPMTLQGMAQSMAVIQQGQWAPAINALNYWFQQQTGGSMPADLVQQITQALNNLPADARNPLAHYMLQMATALTQAEQAQRRAAGGTGQPPVGQYDPNVPIQTFLQQLTQYAGHIFGGSLTSSSASGTVMSNYVAAHPDVTTTQALDIGAEKQNAIKLLDQYGVPVTQDLINLIISRGDAASELTTYLTFMSGNHIPINAQVIQTLLSMPFGDPTSGTSMPGTGGSWLLSQPSSLIKGATWGQQAIAYTAINSLWQQYYGRQPDSKELAWAIGKSNDQIMNQILDSPSKVPGVSIGRYEGISKVIQDFNSGTGANVSMSSVVNDAAVQSLHQAINPPKP